MRMDRDGQCMHINTKWTQLSGQPLRQALGLGWIGAIHPDDRIKVQAALGQLIGSDIPFHQVFRFQNKDHLTWVVGTASKLDDNRGQPLEYLLNLIDISDIKKVEAQLEEQRLRAVRTSKMAALGEMAGGVAHEINNPLAIISGRLAQINRILDKEPLDRQGADKHLKSIAQTVTRIASIVKGLRAFSRTGDEEPFEEFSINKSISDTLSLGGERLRSEGVDIRWQPSADFTVKARTVQISQILLNLVNNARDALRDIAKGEKWLLIETRQHESVVEIAVSDSGPGISKENLEKIWQPFFTTRPVGAGTGLGLSISLGLARENGGELMLDRKSPQTRFVLTLPLVAVKQLAA